jgi:hypothetical protein
VASRAHSDQQPFVARELRPNGMAKRFSYLPPAMPAASKKARRRSSRCALSASQSPT